MIDEPDIVKQLREEERIGKIQYNHFDLKAKIFEIMGMKPKEINNEYNDVKFNSYKDELDLAKKVLNELNKN